MRRPSHALLPFLFVGLAACGNSDLPDPKNGGDDDPSIDAEPEPDGKVEKGGLIISSSPAVEIEVDGKSVGKAPITVNDLEAGVHTVRFLFDDDPMSLDVEIGEGEYQKVHQAWSPDASDAIMGGD
jgi:hypothetical protein